MQRNTPTDTTVEPRLSEPRLSELSIIRTCAGKQIRLIRTSYYALLRMRARLTACVVENGICRCRLKSIERVVLSIEDKLKAIELIDKSVSARDCHPTRLTNYASTNRHVTVDSI